MSSNFITPILAVSQYVSSVASSASSISLSLSTLTASVGTPTIAGVFSAAVAADPLSNAYTSGLGNIVIITADTVGTPATVATAALVTVSNGSFFRVANGNDPSVNLTDTITITDATNTVVSLMPGEFNRVQWFADDNNAGTNARWLKIPGV